MIVLGTHIAVRAAGVRGVLNDTLTGLRDAVGHLAADCGLCALDNTGWVDRANAFGTSQCSIAEVVVIIRTAIAVVGAFANVAGFTDANARLACIVTGAARTIVARDLPFGTGDTAACGLAARERTVVAIVGTSQRVGCAAFAARAPVFQCAHIAVLAGPSIGSWCLNARAGVGVACRAHARVVGGADRLASGEAFALLCGWIADELTGTLVIRCQRETVVVLVARRTVVFRQEARAVLALTGCTARMVGNAGHLIGGVLALAVRTAFVVRAGIAIVAVEQVFGIARPIDTDAEDTVVGCATRRTIGGCL